MTQDAQGPVMTRAAATASSSSHAESTPAPAADALNVAEPPVKQPVMRVLHLSAPAPAAAETQGSSGGAIEATQLAGALEAVQIKTASTAAPPADEAAPEASGSNPIPQASAFAPPQPATAVEQTTTAPVAEGLVAGADQDASLDTALLGALRNGRDRPFVLRHELEMAAFVRDSRCVLLLQHLLLSSIRTS